MQKQRQRKKTAGPAVEQMVRELDQKTSDLEAMYGVLVKVQKTSLTQAERLRQLAKAAITPVASKGDCYALDPRRVRALAKFLKDLAPFHKPAVPKGRKPRR